MRPLQIKMLVTKSDTHQRIQPEGNTAVTMVEILNVASNKSISCCAMISTGPVDDINFADEGGRACLYSVR